jgi:branched-chain amino acid transport system ATP-binding protein
VAEAVLRICDLRKSFGALAVTDGVTLQIAPGQLHAIIGPNGAGKTSLIHQLAGTLAPDAGSIWFDGHEITRMPAANRVHLGLARSFQITSILAGFTVLENVALAVQAHSGSSYRFWGNAVAETALNEPAMAALTTVGLGSRVGINAGRLSHGEKRQLEIAIALATNPKLLLLDEPLAGTGREESSVIINLLRQLRSKLTIILIEHDMDAVFALADRISVLVYGRVVATGMPAEIRDNVEVRAAYLGTEEIS